MRDTSLWPMAMMRLTQFSEEMRDTSLWPMAMMRRVAVAGATRALRCRDLCGRRYSARTLRRAS
eukprot:7281112-Prymnesium_polylepis.1